MTDFSRFMSIIESNTIVRSAIVQANELALADWWLVGGFIRDVVWSDLCGRDLDTRLVNDIDVVYFDPENSLKSRDVQLEREIAPLHEIKWSIKNQSRMHIYDSNAPYLSTIDAMFHFPETLSSVGLRLGSGSAPIAVNCHGLSDLMNMVFRPTQSYSSNHTQDDFIERLTSKGWLKKWPQATIAANE